MNTVNAMQHIYHFSMIPIGGNEMRRLLPKGDSKINTGKLSGTLSRQISEGSDDLQFTVVNSTEDCTVRPTYGLRTANDKNSDGQ